MNKARFSIMLIMPILFIFMLAFSSFNTITIGIVDHDESRLSQSLIDNLRQNNYYKIVIMEEDEVLQNTLSYEVDYALIIKPDFEKRLLNGETNLVTEYYFVENVNIMNVKTYINAYLQDLYQIRQVVEGNENQFFTIFSDYQASTLKVENNANLVKKIEQSSLVIGLTVYFLTIMSIIICGIILEDKKNGTLRRIFDSPITLKRYFLENLLSFMIVGLIQVFIFTLVYRYLFNFYLGQNIFLMLLVLFTYAIVSIAMGLFLVSIFKQPIHAYITVAILASPICMLGGAFWPIEMMPDWLQDVSHFIPTTWVISAAKTVLTQGAIINVLKDVGILLLFALTFFLASLHNRMEFINR